MSWFPPSDWTKPRADWLLFVLLQHLLCRPGIKNWSSDWDHRPGMANLWFRGHMRLFARFRAALTIMSNFMFVLFYSYADGRWSKNPFHRNQKTCLQKVLKEWGSFILFIFKGVEQFMCAHVYYVALCSNAVKNCGSKPLDWLATPAIDL